MRPPEFTGGNVDYQIEIEHLVGGFNEAAGIHRRKLFANVLDKEGKSGFNEAAGIHRRKLVRHRLFAWLLAGLQ